VKIILRPEECVYHRNWAIRRRESTGFSVMVTLRRARKPDLESWKIQSALYSATAIPSLLLPLRRWELPNTITLHSRSRSHHGSSLESPLYPPPPPPSRTRVCVSGSMMFFLLRTRHRSAILYHVPLSSDGTSQCLTYGFSARQVPLAFLSRRSLNAKKVASKAGLKS